jgi:hypothetical protein
MIDYKKVGLLALFIGVACGSLAFAMDELEKPATPPLRNGGSSEERTTTPPLRGGGGSEERVTPPLRGASEEGGRVSPRPPRDSRLGPMSPEELANVHAFRAQKIEELRLKAVTRQKAQQEQEAAARKARQEQEAAARRAQESSGCCCFPPSPPPTQSKWPVL